MKKLNKSLLVAIISLTSACSTMNENFSCNLTAGDSCMSLDEVNAMTERNAIHVIPKAITKPTTLQKTKVRRVWLSPFTDSRGVMHKGGQILVPELDNEVMA